MNALQAPVEDLLAIVEAAAARGQPGADQALQRLLEEEQRTGDLGVISRLSVKKFMNNEK